MVRVVFFMRVDKFIEMLKKYPQDKEIKIDYTYENKDIFTTFEDENGDVIISSAPWNIDKVVYCEKHYENVQYNVDDEFTFYNKGTDDVLTGKYNDLKVTFEGHSNEYDDEEVIFENPNFSLAGDLRRFLQAFPDDTKININCGGSHNGEIHEIMKTRVCYFTGVDYRNGDVYEECFDELFLIYGVPVSGYCGGGSFPLKNNKPLWWTDEVEKVIAEPIREQLKDTVLSDEDKEWWTGLVTDIKKNLGEYYSFYYQLNGGWDSNGEFHPRDKKELYYKPKFTQKKEE